MCDFSGPIIGNYKGFTWRASLGNLPSLYKNWSIASGLQLLSGAAVKDSEPPQFTSVQSLSHVRLFATPCIAAHQPPCPSPATGVHLNSRPSSRWCHPTISSSVVPFTSCPQSLPASESFPMSQLFAWGGQSTGVSALASFLPKKSQGWSPSEWKLKAIIIN